MSDCLELCAAWLLFWGGVFLAALSYATLRGDFKRWASAIKQTELK